MQGKYDNMKLRKLHDKTHREEHRIRGGKIKEWTFDKNFSMFLEVSTVHHHSNVFCVHFSTSLKDLKLNLTEPTSYLNLFGVLCDHDFVVSTLGYFASHYRVMSGFTNSPTTKCRRKLDEIYDLVTALIFRGFQRLTEETGKEENFKVEVCLSNDFIGLDFIIYSLLAAGGAMYVEVFNRVIQLAYNIIKRNKVGETNTYLDGTYYCFT
ncbi:hypothetical protein HID58_050540 [Brassica napus]|uniref:Uncharacterized protein n=1 Tax=Brassica napus TaxID=3708 RepID=A0ABQ8A7N5_BRANA|nr:hypothetical protein HID58_050540 [Brassica napus]